MSLLDIYISLDRGDIDAAQAAEAFGFSEQQLKFRTTRWGHRLPLLLATLDKLTEGTIGRDEAAEVLDCSPRQVNKLQQSWSAPRPLKEYLVSKASTQIKWEIHKKYAVDFIGGGVTLADAAECAGISQRQMRREVTKLLMKHYDMPWKDLAKLSVQRQKRLADAIENAENLEYAKQRVLRAIAEGDRSIREEALNRVLSKRTMRDRSRRASDNI